MSIDGAEIVIAGGGSAGLSAALTLARARRRVVVVDSGEPRNGPAAGAHGLLGQEGIGPLALLRKGRDEILSYGARIVSESIADARAVGDGFRLTTGSGEEITARAVLIATGTRDELPDIPGLAERWGRDVIHCPYCHGWEISDQRIGVLATGPMSALQALMFNQWSGDVRFFPQGMEYAGDDLAKLAATGIAVDDRHVTGVDVHHNRLRGVRLDDGATVVLDALVVPTSTRARLDGLSGLRVEVGESPSGTAVTVDSAGHTSVPGVWAAGNVAHPAMQVSEAAANGARVAMTLNTEFVFQDVERAVHEAGSRR